MTRIDHFGPLARYYDELMEHVDYDRWATATLLLGDLLPPRPRHLDAACGTGTLVGKLRPMGWRSVGCDLSAAMVRQALRKQPGAAFFVADMRRLPVRTPVDCVTCLFDSINFLPRFAQVEETIRQFSAALAPGGILYFDIVTERMVTEHFAGQSWSERTGRLTSHWDCAYDAALGVSETAVRVNQQGPAMIREFIHDRAAVAGAIEAAGLTLLGQFDAATWRKPSRKSLRIDFVAAKAPPPSLDRRFAGLAKAMRKMLGK